MNWLITIFVIIGLAVLIVWFVDRDTKKQLDYFERLDLDEIEKELDK